MTKGPPPMISCPERAAPRWQEALPLGQGYRVPHIDKMDNTQRRGTDRGGEGCEGKWSIVAEQKLEQSAALGLGGQELKYESCTLENLALGNGIQS